MAMLDAGFALRALVNLPRQRMNRAMVGFVAERTFGPISAELAAAYAAATADDNPRYQGLPGALAPPLLISRLTLPLFKEVMVHPRLRMNLLRTVHGEQDFAWERPMRVGDRVRVRLRVEDLRQTSAGDLLVLTGEARNAEDNALFGTARAGVLVRAWRRRPRGNGSRGATVSTPPAEVQRINLQTTADQALRYAAASGDDNFIHTSPLLARAAGLPGTVLHGMCVLAMASAAIVRERLGGDLDRAAGLRGRFASFVRPGDALAVVLHASPADGELPFAVLDSQDRVVIKDAVLRVRS